MKKNMQPTGRQFFAFALASLLLLSGCSKNQDTALSSMDSSSAPTSQSVASSELSSAISLAPQVSSAVSSNKPVSSEKPVVSSKPSVPITSPTAPVSATAGAVSASAKVNMSYLDDAVFVGDSVSLKLKLYAAKMRQSDAGFLGKAQFLVQGSMGSGNALQPVSSTSIHPSYNGKKMPVEDSIAEMGAKKVYMMLGMNDIAVYGIDGSARNMGVLIGRIRAKSPNIAIMVQSATPMIQNMQRKDLNNKNMYAYDQKLAALCVQNGYHFIDVAEVMRDNNGALIANYCSDPQILGMHFTDTACQVWIDYLLTHTA